MGKLWFTKTICRWIRFEISPRIKNQEKNPKAMANKEIRLHWQKNTKVLVFLGRRRKIQEAGGHSVIRSTPIGPFRKHAPTNLDLGSLLLSSFFLHYNLCTYQHHVWSSGYGKLRSGRITDGFPFHADSFQCICWAIRIRAIDPGTQQSRVYLVRFEWLIKTGVDATLFVCM